MAKEEIKVDVVITNLNVKPLQDRVLVRGTLGTVEGDPVK